MDTILDGIVNFIKSKDKLNKFKVITCSEFLEDLINKNQLPFIDIVGLKENKTELKQIAFKYGYKQTYTISIMIFQDAKALKDVLKGNNSIWGLWNYVWSMIEADNTFGGLVDGFDSSNIESKLVTMQKDNTIKIGLETQLTLTKDILRSKTWQTN